MGMIGLYGWGLPKQATILNQYANDETLYNMARAMWGSLDTACLWFFITAIALGIVVACIYYYLYNKKAGRRYKIAHWGVWLGITALLSFIVTLLLGNSLVKSNLQDLSSLLTSISLINALFSVVVYILCSFIICNIPVPTNAYRFLKIGK